ncbi:MAG: glucosamine-6-phosphate deaminase [Acidobacteriota bacterium]|nr:glucosamine-6-phosphate deaminase [Acidobacteriota bacterium]
MGAAAAEAIAAALRQKLQQQPTVRMIFAAAPSQSTMLAALRVQPGLEWSRVEAFHMDEYLGLPKDAPQRFASWLADAFFRHVPIGAMHRIEPHGDGLAECTRYAALLRAAPIDFVLLGVGTNGHLAFNDPPADLADPALVKVVQLDQMCREQQVFDGCFPTLDEVPKAAITLTVPALLSAAEIFGCIPGAHKRAAVRAMLEDPISGACPATALRTHPRCTVYLDAASSPRGGQ